VGFLPAHPATVAAYLRHLEGAGRKVSTISRALASISEGHKAAGHDSPRSSMVVRKTLQAIPRRLGVAPAQKAPLLAEQLRTMVAGLGSDLQDLRDRALLLVGFSGAFRRSELVGLNVEDVTFNMRPFPPFPEDAVAAGKQDLVIADVDVDDQGRVTGIHVLRGSPEFSKAVTDNVTQWRYRPAKRGGKAAGDTVPLILPFVRQHEGVFFSESWMALLRDALKDPSEEIRIRTVGYIGSVPLPLQKSEASALLATALQDQSVTVRRLANVYLQQMGANKR
jgi:hypothetical protein